MQPIGFADHTLARPSQEHSLPDFGSVFEPSPDEARVLFPVRGAHDETFPRQPAS